MTMRILVLICSGLYIGNNNSTLLREGTYFEDQNQQDERWNRMIYGTYWYRISSAIFRRDVFITARILEN